MKKINLLMSSLILTSMLPVWGSGFNPAGGWGGYHQFGAYGRYPSSNAVQGGQTSSNDRKVVSHQDAAQPATGSSVNATPYVPDGAAPAPAPVGPSQEWVFGEPYSTPASNAAPVQVSQDPHGHPWWVASSLEHYRTGAAAAPAPVGPSPERVFGGLPPYYAATSNVAPAPAREGPYQGRVFGGFPPYFAATSNVAPRQPQ